MLNRVKIALGAILAVALLFSAPILPQAALQSLSPNESVTLRSTQPSSDGMPPTIQNTDAWVVMDAETGQVILSQNAEQALYPASITKILTVGLALEVLDYPAVAQEKVLVSQSAIDALIPRASMVALIPGEEVTVEDLLYATCVESANDAAHVLAEYIGGSMEGFAQMMNDKAAQLGLSGSNFTNSSGQPDENHYVTAHDMAVITRWALSLPYFRELFSATQHQMQATNIRPAPRELNNANMALHSYSDYYCEGVTASKTGYTDDALYTLITTAARGEAELICVVLKCATNEEKYNATNALLDYVFDNFRRVDISAQTLSPGPLGIYSGEGERLGEMSVYAPGGISLMMHNNLNADNIGVRYDVPQSYIIGEAFNPATALYITQAAPFQQEGDVASVPLTWSGLEEVLVQQGELAPAPTQPQQAIWPWAVLIVCVLVVGLCVMRILYVRHRRRMRRMRRLETMRAQTQIYTDARPMPYRKPLPKKTSYARTSYAKPLPPLPTKASQSGGYHRRPPQKTYTRDSYRQNRR